jgi:RNA polymerase sigma-70 factor (ECF subfamily)
MVTLHLDQRLAGRVDPSDVVQDSFITASRRLPEYAQQRPIPFYPWLRQIAWERLLDLHRHHLAYKRSVLREQRNDWQPTDESVMQLAERLVSAGSSPSQRLKHQELRERVRCILAELSETDREVLVLRYLEQLSVSEAAAVLGINEDALTRRHTRALQRFRLLMQTSAWEPPTK